MNVVPMIKHTKAEEALLSSYEGVANKSESSDAAIASLKVKGLPTRRVEEWHYTDLRSALSTVPSALISGQTDAAAFLEGASVVALGTASDAVTKGTIGELNTAFATEGVSISVEGEAGEPIEFHTAASNGAVHTRNSVSFAAGASGTVIERQTGEGGFATAVTELNIGEGAEASYIILQTKDKASSHLGQLNVTLGKDANFTLFVLNAGGKLIRHDLNIDVLGEGADFQLRGVNLIGDDQHIDVTMNLLHGVPNTTSEEIIRNVVTGRGKGVFQGQIRVAQIAQKTDAKMACNTLLLSDEGDFSTKPELEIFADDVACGHGATFADIEPSYMFYLMSRGIPEREARALLIKGFVDEIVEDLDNEPLEEALVNVIDSWLDANG